MTTIAPATAELDRWANLGKTGWDYQSLLPLFRRIVTDRVFGASDIHGGDRQIVIYRYRREIWAPTNGTFADACAGAGIDRPDDLNLLDSNADVAGAMPHNRFKEAK